MSAGIDGPAVSGLGSRQPPPALLGRAVAAPLKLKLPSSLPNDPKYANGRVYYDFLVKQIAAHGLAEQIGSRSVLAKFPLTELGQLTGKKNTQPAEPGHRRTRPPDGAAATPLAFGEIYTVLQAGVLDGLEHDPPTIVASKFYEIAKYYALMQRTFDALKQKGVAIAACDREAFRSAHSRRPSTSCRRIRRPSRSSS